MIGKNIIKADLLDYINKSYAKAIELHRELISRVAINPEHGGVGEDKKARWIEQWLDKNGLCDVERVDSIDERVPGKVRPNLIARYRPKNCKHMLWIVTHLDTVASGPREYWDSDPFILRMDGDRLYGRGVEDNNQAIVSALLLLDAIKELIAHQDENSVLPNLGLGLVCVSAGITDYTKGIDVILKKHPKLFSAKDMIVVPDFGNEYGSIIEASEKRSLWLKVNVDGQEYHAGYGVGTNAFEAAAMFMSRLRPLRERFAYPNPYYDPIMSTITPTHSETSCTGLNHVASRFSFYLDIRIVPEYPIAPIVYELQQLGKQIEKEENVHFSFETIELSPDAPATPETSPVIKILKSAIQDELGIDASLIGVGGVTLVSVIRSLGLPVAVWSIQSGKKVKYNESISLQAQIAQTCVFARMLYVPRVRTAPKIVFPATVRAQKITNAEFEVGKLVGEGFSNEKIIEELGLTVNTIRTHLKRLYRKTNAKNREELRKLFEML